MPEPIVNGRHINQDDTALRGTILFMPVGRSNFDDACEMARIIAGDTMPILMSDWVHPGTWTPYPYDDPRLAGKHGIEIEPYQSREQIATDIFDQDEGIYFAIHNYPCTTGLFSKYAAPGVPYADPPADWSEILVSTIARADNPEYDHLEDENTGVSTWTNEFKKVGVHFSVGRSIQNAAGRWRAWGTPEPKNGIKADYHFLPTVSTGFMLKAGTEPYEASRQAYNQFVRECDFSYVYNDGFMEPNRIGENFVDHANRQKIISDRWLEGWNGLRMWGGHPPETDQCNRRNVLTDALTVEGKYENDPAKWFEGEKARAIRNAKPSNSYVTEFGWYPLCLQTTRLHIYELFNDDVTGPMPKSFQVLKSWRQKDEDERNSIVKLIGQQNSKGN